jgi:hypothetical protein
MDHPPSTTSPSRRTRRALLSTAAAFCTLAVPGTIAARGGPSLIAEVRAESSSPAVRFLGASNDGGTTLSLRPVRSQIEGLQGLTTTTFGADAEMPVGGSPLASTTTTAAPAPAPQRVQAPAPAPVQAPAPAPAPAAPKAGADPNDPATWDRLARCEASGNWAANTGNGYYGGLQFSASSWRSVGGTGLPHQASRETQIEMGKRLQARAGWKSWPSCSRRLGYR